MPSNRLQTRTLFLSASSKIEVTFRTIDRFFYILLEKDPKKLDQPNQLSDSFLGLIHKWTNDFLSLKLF